MKNFVTFIRGALLIDEKSQTRIGLSQFKEEKEDFSINENSIRNKDIKLSVLLRRS